MSSLSLGVEAVHTRDGKALSFLTDIRYLRQKIESTQSSPEGYKEICTHVVYFGIISDNVPCWFLVYDYRLRRAILRLYE